MKNKVTRSLFNNLPYKITAIFLAFLFWYIVQGEEILEINRRVTVQVKVPEGYVVRGEEVRHKDATLRGSRVLLGDFSAKPLEAIIRVPPGSTGMLRYRIDKEFIKGWDNRIRMTVHDPYITVFVDEKSSKKVPVREFLKGSPAEGTNIEKATIKPSIVTITGLKSDIAKVEEVFTEAIDIENLATSKTFDVKVYSKEIPKAELTPDRVSVSLSIGEKKINKRFTAIPIEFSGTNVNIKPKFVSIVIQGTPGVLNFVKKSDLSASIDTRDLAPGKYDKPVQVKIPADTVLIETFPQNVNVEIK